MAKSRFTSVRIALAFGVAAVADGLQFPINAFTGTGVWALPGELADFVLDVIVCGLLSLLIGFHLILLPGFILKAIPSVDAIPTWTATVGFLVWSKKRQAQNQPQAATATETAEAGEAQPAPAPENPSSATLSAVTPPPTLKSPGLWYLVGTVFLLGGLIYFFTHKPPPPPPPPPPYETTNGPVTWPKGRPVVVVGHIEDQTALNSSRRKAIANPERIRAELGEMLREIDGVEVLEEPQAQAFLSKWEGSGGLPDAQSVTVVRVTILDMQATAAKLNAYGVAMKSLDTECSLRLRVMRGSDNAVIFSKAVTGSKTQTQTEAAQSVSTEDPNFAAVKAALRKAEKDAAFIRAVSGGKTSQVPPEPDSNQPTP